MDFVAPSGKTYNMLCLIPNFGTRWSSAVEVLPMVVDAKKLIEELGGPMNVARIAGVPKTNVYRYRERGSIPFDVLDKITHAASNFMKEGFELPFSIENGGVHINYERYLKTVTG